MVRLHRDNHSDWTRPRRMVGRACFLAMGFLPQSPLSDSRDCDFSLANPRKPQRKRKLDRLVRSASCHCRTWRIGCGLYAIGERGLAKSSGLRRVGAGRRLPDRLVVYRIQGRFTDAAACVFRLAQLLWRELAYVVFVRRNWNLLLSVSAQSDSSAALLRHSRRCGGTSPDLAHVFSLPMV